MRRDSQDRHCKTNVIAILAYLLPNRGKCSSEHERAKREGWTRQIQSAKALAKREKAETVVSPFEAVSASIQQRGETHVQRMANIVEKTLPHVEAMQPGAILDCIDDVDTLDKVARRTFGLNDVPLSGFSLNVLNLGSRGLTVGKD